MVQHLWITHADHRADEAEEAQCNSSCVYRSKKRARRLYYRWRAKVVDHLGPHVKRGLQATLPWRQRVGARLWRLKVRVLLLIGRWTTGGYPGSEADLRASSVPDLKRELAAREVHVDGIHALEKEDLVQALLAKRADRDQWREGSRVACSV
mmetsp:Transcript_35294/g.59499  ORF Transcript_35294/g.59499 Transcript_35294/m.59499 type:complete len:152 (+) Transcript_35294:339-794(+)|eukprot:CAMPEP_0198216376 /NCGR_PEP_ID=MMETSP1445-20131203/57062_1 /TAXON_ID=36898 /ORGANISM="Pyramimonas sp., Strain CCMP2087" /LENGTH=151 /DNA_ID=CAMNT_0043892589 /DNA_START=252 /DNA_END=707 /DNA_ORIENTATION=-